MIRPIGAAAILPAALLLVLNSHAAAQQAAREPARERDLFVNLPFESACKMADEGHKIVFIDFFTTWCGPCKLLDRTTWKDDKVRAWLTERAVSLKIDAERDRPLSGRYGVNVYPTLLFVRPDGVEIGRLRGYRDAESFLRDAEALLANKVSSEPTSAEQLNPMQRMQQGDRLAQQGKYDQALQEYLWCFDEGLTYNPAFVGVRISFLLASIARLGVQHPAALAALEQRRDAAEKKLRAGRGSFQCAADLQAINRVLNQPERTLALYDELKKAGADGDASRELLKPLVAEALRSERRYAEYLEASPGTEETLDLLTKDGPPAKGFFGAMFGGGRKPEEDAARNQAWEMGGGLFEAFLGVGKQEEARRIAVKMARYDPSADGLQRLVARAKRAGAEEVVRRLTETPNEYLQRPPADETRPKK